MQARRYLLWAALAAGLLAVVAGLAGMNRVVGGFAAVLLVLFIIVPWAGEERP